MPRAAFDPSLASFVKPVPSAPSFLKYDPNRAPRFWHAAVSATKGLFNHPSRAAFNDDVTTGAHVPLVEQRQKRIRKSISTPILKASSSTPNLRRDASNALSPPVPLLFAKRSFEQSPRKLRSKAAAGSSAARRPVISSPSLPKSLDSLDSSAHSKLAYPLSSMPSPVESTFSLKPPIPQATSSLMNDGASPDDTASADTDACSASRSVRRRTKSAPGPKFGKQALFSPALSVAPDSETSSIEPFSPIVIDIASPSIASPNSCSPFPSPPLYTPAMPSGCFSDSSSPLVQVASPRSFIMSVKRKPVPRHLYMDPPEHDASAPCTPVFTPIHNSSPGANTLSGASRGEGSATLHTPLLPSSELILKACNPSRSNGKGLNLLPIGQTTTSAGPARRNHRHSVSEHGYRRLFNQDAAVGLPSPWYTTNASGSMTQLVTPAEEHAPFSFANDLPAAPRPVQTPPQTPTPVAEEISAFSDNTSVRSSVCRTGALSPLTDDEIDALRNFLRRHATGHRERQRRKATKRRETRSRSTSVVSYSYDMHTQIYDCYANNDDEFLSGDASEDDADAESHMPMSASETHSTSTASVTGTQLDGEDEPDYSASASVNGDAVEAPIDSVNRGTFGYYGTPVTRRPVSCLEPSYEYIPEKDSEGDARPSLSGEWRTFSESPRAEKTGRDADEFPRFRSDDVNCDGREDSTVNEHTRSSSVYYPFSSDPSPRGHFDYLRISHQPLVPRMSGSDSESDRPSSSSTSSLSPSTTTGRSALASGIGLAIIPPEHFAHFDSFERYEYVPPCSPSELDAADDSEGSPTMLGCASPLDSLRSCGHRRFASTFPDLSRFQADEDVEHHYSVGGATPVLKPALHINASFSASNMGQLPSPTDTIESYPSQTLNATKSSGKLATPEVGRYRGAASADEAMADVAKSFMNLTPNEPAPKRSRVKLRQLFSRSNLKSAATRKAST